MDFVDLHVHSNASDGTFSPSQVVELAKNAGLDAFALTDHDTTAGVPEALEKGRDLNIEVIPGIEVSSSFDGTEIHILGLFVNSDDPVLAAMLEKMRISRDRRNEIGKGSRIPDAIQAPETGEQQHGRYQEQDLTAQTQKHSFPGNPDTLEKLADRYLRTDHNEHQQTVCRHIQQGRIVRKSTGYQFRKYHATETADPHNDSGRNDD